MRTYLLKCTDVLNLSFKIYNVAELVFGLCQSRVFSFVAPNSDEYHLILTVEKLLSTLEHWQI